MFFSKLILQPYDGGADKPSQHPLYPDCAVQTKHFNVFQSSAISRLEKHGINKALINHVFLGKDKHFNDIY
jgi:hypothetical protein